jgi:gamma-glutamyltranspeptidase/glutathione hydrolase
LVAKFGTLGLDRLLSRAIDLAENGFPVYRELSWVIDKEAQLLKGSAPAEKVFFSRGRAPLPGELLVQADLAGSLKKIAQDGRDVFYRGDLGEAFLDLSTASGGLFTRQDLTDHTSTWQDPIRTDYRGISLCTQPPNSQGIAWLMQANIVENLDLVNLVQSPADYIHLLIEAKKLTFADRDRYVCDPGYYPVPVERMLTKDHAGKQLTRIDMDKAAIHVAPTEFVSAGEDTVYLAVVDRDGNAVSLIQSLYEAFGSGVMVEGTGILLHNRGYDFRLNADHVNRIEPHKRPYHTLTPAMILKNGHPFVVLGSPGADGQTQTLMQLTADLIDFSADVQEAVEAPRWRSNPDNTLLMEGRFDGSIVAELRKRGHKIEIGSDWDPICGGAQIILMDTENGILMGGADPRRQAYAIGC